MADKFDLVVVGGGPGGYVAAIRAAQLGLKTACIEKYKGKDGKLALGGTCLNVGCIPSKALLHVAAVMDEVSHMADLGVSFGAPELDIKKLRAHKEKVIGKLTGGLGAMAKMRKVTVVHGEGKFTDPHTLVVDGKPIRFAQAIIAADPELTAPEYEKLRRMVMIRYGESLELVDVG